MTDANKIGELFARALGLLGMPVAAPAPTPRDALLTNMARAMYDGEELFVVPGSAPAEPPPSPPKEEELIRSELSDHERRQRRIEILENQVARAQEKAREKAAKREAIAAKAVADYKATKKSQKKKGKR